MWDQRTILNNLMLGRKNNFDFIRFVAASLVIFSHSYGISLGHEQTEPLMIITDGQSIIGFLAVIIFFISSGFLITQSYDKSRNPIYFLFCRALRIFPGLIVVVLLTVFLLGPIVTTSSFTSYFTSVKTYDYLKSILLWPMSYHLPGVFEQNINNGVVNGSLWTLAYEFICYIIVLILGILGLFNKKNLLLLLFIITYILSFFSFPIGNQILELFSAFAAGGIIYLFRDKIPIDDKLALISMIVIFLSTFTNYFIEIFTIFGSYFVFYLAYTPRMRLSHFGKYGDFSYGIYIFGFPIQQIFVYCLGGQMDPFLNFVLSYPVILCFAIASWHLVEKNALKLKIQYRRTLVYLNKESRYP